MPTTVSPEALPEGVEVLGPAVDRQDEVLTPDALAFLAELHRRFDATRQELLQARTERQAAFDAGALPGFLPETLFVREDPEWRVGPIPEGLQDRRVEITGPIDRKMMINALNSDAKVFMADCEDSNSPTWSNNVSGQANIMDAVRGDMTLEANGKEYVLGDDPATLVVRARGWHLDEAHMRIDGAPISASLFDFGLCFWHNAKEQVERGAGPWFYLPKLEHHLEARLWNDVFLFAQEAVGLPIGAVKATVLIETFPAVFQMEEILYELAPHMAGLNAGRWDYIFSCIKTMRRSADHTLPDRGQVTMTVPFMRAYSELLVKTCHKRGAFAMGGMSAFIPNRRDPDVTENALAQVRADKEREVADGCDGTWVAHPDLIPLAMEIFEKGLDGAPNQADRQRDDVHVSAADLLDFSVEGGQVTEAGLRNNIDVAVQYLEAWLRGSGAVAIYNLMEDAATAEISRSQIWQWLRHGTRLDDGRAITPDLVDGLLAGVLDQLRGDERPRLDEAAELFRAVALADDFPAFLTLPAYDRLTKETLA